MTRETSSVYPIGQIYLGIASPLQILPCLHSFCMKCLDAHVQKRPLDDEKPGGDKRDILVCSLCHDPKSPVELPPGGIKGLKTNFSIENLVHHLKLEDTVTGAGSTSSHDSASSETELIPNVCGECDVDKAISFCTWCNMHLCSQCDEHHRRVRKTKEHQIVLIANSQASIDTVMKGPSVATGPKVKGGIPSEAEFSGVSHNPWKCEKHPNDEVELYCKPCDKIICLRCAITTHKQHDYAFANETEAEYKGIIVELTQQTQDIEQKFEQAIETVSNTKTGLENTKQSTERRVQLHYDQIKAELDKQRDILLLKVKSIADKKKARLDAQLSELGRVKETLQTCVKFSRDIRENCIPVEFLFLWKQINNRLEDLCAMYGPYPREPRDNDMIIFQKNDDLEKRIRESNTVGAVFSNPDPMSFTADDIENQHFTENKEATFRVTCRDIIGNGLTEHRHEVKAEIRSERGDPIQCQVVNNQNGTYAITIEPQTHGPHQIVISVVVDDKTIPIREEPFHIIVSPPHQYNITAAINIRKEAAGDKMKNPWGIAVSKEEKVVVSDVQTDCLLVFNREGNLLRTIGKEGKGELEFKSPRGLACTPANHIIVAEKVNHRLQEVTLEGQFVRFFGTNEAGKPGGENGQFHGPSCVAVNSEGTVFATDSLNQRIQFFKPDGTFLGIIGQWGHGRNLLNDPYGISIYRQPQVLGKGSRELIFVTERQGHRVQCFEKMEDGTYISVKIFGERGGKKGQIGEPVDILVHPQSGYLFVTELQNQRISIFSRNGEYINSFGERGNGPAHFNNPMSIAVFEDSQIIVTDCGNGRVQTFRFS